MTGGQQELTIQYSTLPSVTFKSASSMKKHLRAEAIIWEPFLTEISKRDTLKSIPLIHGSTSLETLSQVFDFLEAKLDNPKDFNRSTQANGRSNICPPPPATSLDGQLILGLYESSRLQDALCAYLWFVDQNLRINKDAAQQIGRMVNRGDNLIISAYAASVLPFRQVTSQKLAGALRSVENNVSALNEEVGNAQSINSDHKERLSEFRDLWKERAHRVERIIFRRESHRRKEHRSWQESIHQDVSDRFVEAEKKLAAIDRANSIRQKKQQEEFDRLLDLFHTQLRLRAPVKLWEARSSDHTTKSKWAFIWFFLGTTLAMLFGALIPFYAGDYIASSFFTEVCPAGMPPYCTREFSAKGPLTIAGILVIMSVLLWAIRLQYRVYLSERHLALDASEKQAFAETYLAMKEGEDVGSDNEAIVLASLFRPTQDGIIKDDDTGLDLSAATILAKQLGRNNP